MAKGGKSIAIDMVIGKASVLGKMLDIGIRCPISFVGHCLEKGAMAVAVVGEGYVVIRETILLDSLKMAIVVLVLKFEFVVKFVAKLEFKVEVKFVVMKVLAKVEVKVLAKVVVLVVKLIV